MNRIEFVKLWAKYVREHDDKVWSRQQNLIINSAIESSTITKEQFLAMQ